jgi:iron(III) transport system permease protein
MNVSIRLPSWLFTCVVALVLAVFSVPIITLLFSLFEPLDDDFYHLKDTVLADYVLNSLGLMVGVAMLTMLIAVPTAWLLAQYQFVGQKWLVWMMFLPLAFPPYVVSFVFAGLFEYAGPVQTYLRDVFEWQKADYWFPHIRSLGGAILVISLTLYPYVYMLSYMAFKKNRGMNVVAKSLGLNGWQTFYRLGVPSIRPAIAVGVSLALMEALADLGTVEYFAVDTFTTGIYRSWFGMGNAVLASKLACALLMFVLVIVALERISRGKANYQEVQHHSPSERQPLVGAWKVGCWALCLLPVGLGFILPLSWLIYHSIRTYTTVADERFWGYLANTVYVSGAAVVLTVLISLVFAYVLRFSPKNGALRPWIRLASFGYAVPGAVVAVALLFSLSYIDKFTNLHVVVGGSAAALVFAYSFRFLALGLGSVESGMLRIRNEYLWLGRLYGLSQFQGLKRIHVPIISGNVLVACLLVFVECVKELPATMIIRPFNFDTLATKAYEYASDERLYEASFPALLIVGIGIVPVILLNRSLRA